jgi:hypothetical protein
LSEFIEIEQIADHDLRTQQPGIDTGATEPLALDDCSFHSCISQMTLAQMSITETTPSPQHKRDPGR